MLFTTFSYKTLIFIWLLATEIAKKMKKLKKYKAQKPLKGKNVLRVKENMLLAFHKISWYKNVAVACGSVRKTSKIQMIFFYCKS